MCTRGEEIKQASKREGVELGIAKNTVDFIDNLVCSLAKPLEEVCALLGTTLEAYMSAKTLIGK